MHLIFHHHILYEYFRLHHRAGSKPIELHGSVYEVICLDCGTSISRESFQEQVKDLNPKVCPSGTGYIFSLKTVVHYISDNCVTFNNRKIYKRCHFCCL
jgi:NAD-dependent SIR2 family protein deacetylase